jgi:hypothetical protein
MAIVSIDEAAVRRAVEAMRRQAADVRAITAKVRSYHQRRELLIVEGSLVTAANALEAAVRQPAAAMALGVCDNDVDPTARTVPHVRVDGCVNWRPVADDAAT